MGGHAVPVGPLRTRLNYLFELPAAFCSQEALAPKLRLAHSGSFGEANTEQLSARMPKAAGPDRSGQFVDFVHAGQKFEYGVLRGEKGAVIVVDAKRTYTGRAPKSSHPDLQRGLDSREKFGVKRVSMVLDGQSEGNSVFVAIFNAALEARPSENLRAVFVFYPSIATSPSLKKPSMISA